MATSSQSSPPSPPQLAREDLLKRVEHEAGRANRTQDALDRQRAETKASDDARALLSQQADASAAEVRSLHLRLAEQRELVAQHKMVVESLRDEAAVMEEQWASQLEDASARVHEQLQALQRQSEGQVDLREQYLGKVAEVVSLQLGLERQERATARLTAELADARVRVGTLSCELEQSRARADAAAAHGAAADDLVVAAQAAAADAKRAAVREQEAHARTRAQLSKQRHLAEHARCAAVDLQATASRAVVRLTASLAYAQAEVARLTRAHSDAAETAEMHAYQAESAKATRRAAKEQLERALVELKEAQRMRFRAEQDAARQRQLLEATTADLSDARAHLAQMAEVERLSERQATRVEELEGVAAQRDAAQRCVEELQARLEEADVGALDKRACRAEAQLAETIKSLGAARKELGALRKAHEEVGVSYGEVAAQLKVREARLSDLGAEVEQHKALLDAKAATVQQLQDDLTDTGQKLAASREALLLASTKRDAAEKMVEQARMTIEGLRARVADMDLLKVRIGSAQDT